MAVSTKRAGPTMFDVHGMLKSLSQRFLVQCSLVMEPRADPPGSYNLMLIAERIPRTPTECLNAATGIPNAVTWGCRWSDTSNHTMPSMFYRGCWEIELELLELVEQLGLPAVD